VFLSIEPAYERWSSQYIKANGFLTHSLVNRPRQYRTEKGWAWVVKRRPELYGKPPNPVG